MTEVKPVAWIDNSGHPHHLSYVQGVREKQLYGPLRPLYDQAALDAVRAEERERCAKVWRRPARVQGLGQRPLHLARSNAAADEG